MNIKLSGCSALYIDYMSIFDDIPEFIDSYIVAQIVGHKQEGMTFGRLPLCNWLRWWLSFTMI